VSWVRDTIGSVVTFLLYLLGLVVVGGVLFVIASFVFGRGEELASMPKDSTPLELPDERRVVGADVRQLRMPVVFRGYRMTEVDWLLEELAEALDDRDSEIAQLRAARGIEVPNTNSSHARHARRDDKPAE
jgi:DivIVA domain-containing protein